MNYTEEWNAFTNHYFVDGDIELKLNDIFSMIPYVEDSGQDRSITLLSQIDTKQKRVVFKNALRLFKKTAAYRSLTRPYPVKNINYTEQYRITEDSKFSQTYLVNINSLFMFMTILSLYHLYKKSNPDYKWISLENSRIKDVNKYAMQLEKRIEDKNNIESDALRNRIYELYTIASLYSAAANSIMEKCVKQMSVFFNYVAGLEFDSQDIMSNEVQDNIEKILKNNKDTINILIAHFYLLCSDAKRADYFIRNNIKKEGEAKTKEDKKIKNYIDLLYKGSPMRDILSVEFNFIESGTETMDIINQFVIPSFVDLPVEKYYNENEELLFELYKITQKNNMMYRRTYAGKRIGVLSFTYEYFLNYHLKKFKKALERLSRLEK